MPSNRLTLSTVSLLLAVLILGAGLSTGSTFPAVEAARHDPGGHQDTIAQPPRTPPGKITPSPTPTVTPTASNTPTLTPTPSTSPTPTPTPTEGPSCTPTWEVVDSPNPGAGFNKLLDVAAISHDDVWAVGSVTSGQETRQLIEHWDGATWSVVPAPEISVNHDLLGVDGVASDDVWAVGHTRQSELIIEHWDGSQWSSVPAPVTRGLLQDVVAISTDDVWAVGYYYDGGYNTLTLHWDGSSWSEVPSPNGAGGSQLFGVAATASNDVWAVGHYVDDDTFDDKTLILRWDGTAWSVLPSPNPSASLNHLRGVTAVAGDDAWAVGYFSDADATKRTLTLHWDGTSWNTVSSPNANTLDNRLLDVTAVTADDVRAVGYYQSGSPQPGLILRWDGTNWTQVENPADDRLTAIDALTSNDVWGVGGLGFTLTQHWDGAAWSVVSSPNAGTGSNRLRGVSAVATDDVWAVGGSSSTKPLLEHWDGTSWNVVEGPVVGDSGHLLYDVDAIATDDVWAVGEFSNPDEFPQTMTLHWDGATWQHVPSPSPGDLGHHLYGVAALAPDDVWAVGTVGNSNEYNDTLIMHWDGTAWSVIPSPNAAYNNSLYDVFALAPDDVWAVGYHGLAPDFFTLTMHWDGTSWTIVPSPNNGIENIFLGVSGSGPNYVWAVGYWTDAFNTLHPLTAHWDGTSWTEIFAPDPTVFDNSFTDVVAFAGNDVWAVGTAASDTLTMRWDGSQWNVVDSPNVDGNGRLDGISAVSQHEMWAVGSYFDSNSVEQTLTEHYTCK